MEGTSLVRFKAAFVDALNDVLDAASDVTTACAYGAPQQEVDVVGQSGSGVGVWFMPEGEASHAVNVLKGTPLWVDEIAAPVLRIQALGQTTDIDQEDVDTLANTVLGYALAVLFDNPSLGLGDATIQDFDATPEAWSYSAEVVPTNFRGARFDVQLRVSARLKLTLPS